MGAQLIGSGGKKQSSSESSSFPVALPSCLLSSFASPLLAAIQLFVWPCCKWDCWNGLG